MKTMHRNVLTAALCLCLTTTAAWAAPAGQDPSPSGETITASVVRGDIHMGGLLLPDSHQTLVQYTTPDKRINDYHIHFTSALMQWLGGDAHVADLFRLDQGMAYKVLYNKKQYYQCKISGCPTIYTLLQALTRSGHAEKKPHHTYHPEGTEQCPLHRIRRDFTVEKTDQQKTIGQFKTRLYKATYTSIYADDDGNKDSNALEIQFWTTPVTPGIRRIQSQHRKQLERFLSEQHKPASPLARFLPTSIVQSLSAFLGNTSSKGHKWHNQVTKKLARVEGYPVSISLDWFVHANACPAPKKKDDGDSGFSSLFGSGNPLSAVKGMVGHAVEKHIQKHVEGYFRPDPDTPILHWDRTITRIKMKQVSPSVFDVPAGFTKKPMPSLEPSQHKAQ